MKGTSCNATAAAEHHAGAWSFLVTSVMDAQITSSHLSYCTPVLQSSIPLPARDSMPGHCFMFQLNYTQDKTKQLHGASVIINSDTIATSTNNLILTSYDLFDPSGERGVPPC